MEKWLEGGRPQSRAKGAGFGGGVGRASEGRDGCRLERLGEAGRASASEPFGHWL